MAYVIEGGSILEVTYEGKLNNQTFMNVFHYWLEDTSTVPDGRAAALNALAILGGANKLLSKYLDCLSQDAVEIFQYAQWISPLRYRYVTAPGLAQVGLVADDAYPQNVAIAITKQGELANRHNQGTLHLPAVPVTWVGEGKVKPVVAGGALDDLCAQIIAPFVLATGPLMSPVLYNKNEPSESPYIVNADWELASRVMRRRTVGVGE